jgi:small nuclear ribonucleoprotein (snRNP)-like protein
VKSCYSVERFVKVEPKRELPLIHTFLNKHVKVKVDDGFEVSGMLIHYQMENKTLHKPSVLILKNGDGLHVLRGNFENLSEVE